MITIYPICRDEHGLCHFIDQEVADAINGGETVFFSTDMSRAVETLNAYLQKAIYDG